MQKTKNTLFRNLILSLVLLVTIFLVVLAWFTTVDDATAGGLSVTTKSPLGLQASFKDDNNYSATIKDPNAKQFNLISGNGEIENFFIPLLNRSTGEALTPYASKRVAVANEDYYETDLWFRGEEPLSIRLSSDSKIEPKDLSDESRISTFGNFSKDYIAGAARVAFYNVDSNGNETLNNIWIPNSNYELIENTTYTKIEKESTGGSAKFDPPSTGTWILPGTTDYTKNVLYLHERYAQGGSTSLDKQHKKMNYDSATNKYYAVVDIFGDFNVQHMIAVSEEDAETPKNILTNHGYTDYRQYSLGLDDSTYKDYTITVGLSGTYNADNLTWPSMYFGITNNNRDLFNNKLKFNRFQVEVCYDRVNDKFTIVDFIYYENGNPDNVGGALDAAGIGSSESYTLNEGDTVIIAGEKENSLYALSFNDNKSLRALSLGSISDNISVINSNCMFLVEKRDGSPDNVYRLKHLPTGNYLSIDDEGNISLSKLTYNIPEFTLLVGSNGGPLLQSSSGFNISFDGDFSGSGSAESSISIYKGSTYTVNPAGSAEANYSYLVKGQSTPSILATDKYFTDISKAPEIVKLAKIDNSGYYKAHIKVRIWVEGTDREAKTPLAGGIFNNLLNFEGFNIEETTD